MFYKHKTMADGYLNKCKLCTQKDVKKRYYSEEARGKIVEYEKRRFKDPERKKKIKTYEQKMRKKSPGKYRARNVAKSAVRYGRLLRLPCEICGNPKSESHHEDYRKYLEVRWLCRKHHRIAEGKIPF